jgi:hypothetical protein
VSLYFRMASLLAVILWLQHRSLLLRSLVLILCPQHLRACPYRHRRRRILEEVSVPCEVTRLVSNLLMPAFSELPMIRVVQPAYHCLPNGGHGSFLPSASLRLSCDRVFATVEGQVCGAIGRMVSIAYTQQDM